MLRRSNYLGFIVPISLPSTPRMSKLRYMIHNLAQLIYCSNYADRPGCLFTGVHQKLSILLLKKSNYNVKESLLFTTNFYHWYSKNYPDSVNQLINNIEYLKNDIISEEWFKISSLIELDIIHKIEKQNKSISLYLNSTIGSFKIWVNMRLMFWFKSFLSRKESSEYKIFLFDSINVMHTINTVFNSNLMFYFWEVISDCWHLTNRELIKFMLNPKILECKELIEISNILESDLENKKEWVGTKQTEYEYYHKKSKPIIDEIDKVLAQHYGFTDEELDFIINYDIKYRMGKDWLDSGEVQGDDEE